MVTLCFGNLVDALGMMAHSIHALPTRQSVSSDDRVNSLEVCANILGSPTLGAVQPEVVFLSTLVGKWAACRWRSVFLGNSGMVATSGRRPRSLKPTEYLRQSREARSDEGWRSHSGQA
jgi:hypothetical protein